MLIVISERPVQCAELELELIQTHMTQKPMLRVEVGARALRVLIKKCGWALWTIVELPRP